MEQHVLFHFVICKHCSCFHVVAYTPNQFQEQHDPHGQLLFREFLDNLVILAFHLYHNKFG